MPVPLAITYTETATNLSTAFAVKEHYVVMSEGLIVANKVTVTEDDVAFPCEIAERINGRTQNVMRGVMTASKYVAGGLPANLTRLTPKFSSGNYRVVMQLNGSCTYYPVYDHTTKRLMLYSDLSGTEVTTDTSLSGLSFPFMAVGE